MKKSTLLIALVFTMVLTSCTNDKHKVSQKTDPNGYSYETVSNDPLNARIYTLDNGLKVYLRVNRDEPRIETYIPVKAGSTYDPAETTGLAHYLEHMMFKGTSKIGTINWEEESKLIQQISDLYEKHKATNDKDEKKAIYKEIDRLSQEAAKYAVANEYDKLTASIGAKGTNAYTSNERTVYINDIPSNELEKWLQIESERFGELTLRIFHTELEAVYEEFNMSQDNDRRKARYKLYELLFPTHPYGQQTVLGKAEHLKNPSMVNIHNYFDTYYVPNNMAICMSGDLDFDNTIMLIDKYWGKFKASDKKTEKTFAPEKEITKSVSAEVSGPSDEYLTMAYRFDGIGSKDEDMVTMIDMILNNSKAGLIDLDLVKEQKVLQAYSYSDFMKDYGVHFFGGKAKNGQTLEEVKDLIIAEIEKVKNGEFEDWLLEAIINDIKLSNIRGTESNGSAHQFVEAFTEDVKWKDFISKIDRLEKITKADIIEFAKKHYNDNYVVVYKRKGKNDDAVKVEKPEITPVPINRTAQSEFMVNLLNENTERLNPVFVDFDKAINTVELQKGVELNYIKNNDNETFQLIYVVNIGSNNDKELALAVDYLEYLGTTQYSASDLSKEFFKNGLSYNVSSNDERSYIAISGLKKSFNKGIELLEHLLANAKEDQQAYDNFVDDIIKSRENNKTNKSYILWAGMLNRAKYGEVNPTTNILSAEQLKAINPKDLVKKVASLTSYPHTILYYGQDDMNTVKTLLTKYHVTPENLTAIPAKTEYKEVESDKNRVIFVNYDMVQTNILMLTKRNKFDAAITPAVRMFNEYYGGGMGSVVFQEIRESKALAYSAFAQYSQASKVDESDYILGFVATQVDKLGMATDAMGDLLNNMRQSETSFENAKDALLKNIETSRITKSNIFWTKLNNLDKGITYDIREDVYEQAKAMKIDDIQNFFDKNVKGSNYTYLVIADRKLIDMKKLKQLGEVTELSLEEVFNY
ncbi:MAG: insulinase family protein [Bacteroidales bacterium]|nr:insulinase family protein [Bacteroidales bacterium]